MQQVQLQRYEFLVKRIAELKKTEAQLEAQLSILEQQRDTTMEKLRDKFGIHNAEDLRNQLMQRTQIIEESLQSLESIMTKGAQ
jgi:hypothetical protein